MEFQAASLFSVSIFTIFSLIMTFFYVMALRKISRAKKWMALYLLICLVFVGVALAGVLTENFFPLGPLLFGAMIGLGLAFSFGRSGKQLAEVLPLSILIGFQSFRIPLELILHEWASEGTIPGTMTWTGQNWDILSGLMALFAFRFVNKSRVIALSVNWLGFLLLLNVVRVVVFSSPLPFAWPLEKKLLLIAYFPYCLIGPLFVLPALVGHLLAFRKLFSSASAN